MIPGISPPRVRHTWHITVAKTGHATLTMLTPCAIPLGGGTLLFVAHFTPPLCLPITAHAHSPVESAKSLAAPPRADQAPLRHDSKLMAQPTDCSFGIPYRCLGCVALKEALLLLLLLLLVPMVGP